MDSVTEDETDHTTQNEIDVDANVDRPLTTTDIARDLVEEFATERPEYFVFGTYDGDQFPDAETEHLEFIVATQAYGHDDISNAAYWAAHQSELAIFDYETAVDVIEILTVDDETLL